VSQSALHTPVPTGAPWLGRAVVASAVLHALAVVIMLVVGGVTKHHEVEVIDIELAPPPPKAEALPEEHERKQAASAPPEAAAAQQPEQPPPEPSALIDAGVDAPIDAPIDAAPKKKKRPDAGIDAEPMVAETIDAGVDAPELAAGSDTGSGSGSAIVAMVGSGDSNGSGSGSGSGFETGSGSGSGSDMETEAAVPGAPTTAGTAANLLAYFPAGHVVTVLVRFDRMRGTEWAAATQKLLRPLPDYRGLFGERDAPIGDKLDMLVISTPKPKDATATTLVAHSAMSRAELRAFLANPKTPIAWSTAKGGMLGRRSGELFTGDKRVLLAPWKGWFVLAQPADVGTLVEPQKGNIETFEPKAQLPPWLYMLRDIDKESGTEKRGPALVLTFAATRQRYHFPDVGLGVTTLPAPDRVALAVELVKQGWLLRGNIKFASEDDAIEFEKAVGDVKQRIGDSHLLSALLRRQHVLDVVKGLDIARAGDRISYATSISVADARAVLAAAASTVTEYFGQTR
jgi:hypothetical protein